MIKLKNFFLYTYNKEFYVKKVLAQSIYEKYFIRKQFLEKSSKNINYNIYNIDTFKNITNVFLKKKYITGSFLILNKFYFKHKLNKDLQFKSFLSCSLKLKTSLLNDLYLSILCFKRNSLIDFRSIVILKPIKGGFKVYSAGVIGFFSKTQFWFLFKHTLIDLKSIKLNFNSYIKQIKCCISFFRVPLGLVSCSFIPKNVKKKNTIFNRLTLNFIFSFNNKKTVIKNKKAYDNISIKKKRNKRLCSKKKYFK